MTAVMHRSYNLTCNGAAWCSAVFRGHDNEPRAATRHRAARNGWTHVRDASGRRFDADYCPTHKPAGKS